MNLVIEEQSPPLSRSYFSYPDSCILLLSSCASHFLVALLVRLETDALHEIVNKSYQNLELKITSFLTSALPPQGCDPHNTSKHLFGYLSIY